MDGILYNISLEFVYSIPLDFVYLSTLGISIKQTVKQTPMDLSQTKLSKAEWLSIEVAVSDAEKKVLELIMAGYNQPEIRENRTLALFPYMKIEPNPELEYYLYKEYFETPIREIVATAAMGGATEGTPSHKKGRDRPAVDRPPGDASPGLSTWVNSVKALKCKPPNKADMIRIQSARSTIQTNTHRESIFEFILLDFCKGALGGGSSPGDKEEDVMARRGFYLYSLVQFQKYTIPRINRYVSEFVRAVLQELTPDSPAQIRRVFAHSAECMEQNPYLIRFEDQTLYSHQKQLFRLFHSSPYIPKLVLYTAPTGTGKTLSPIGLSQRYRVIFVCVARHVGLALAKSAISVGKRVAFAFGCTTASDIRLHYFAAKDYKINKRSGGIGKVDNSVGDKVEIMICDVASYLTAMYYMLAFNDESTLITYWDEPTITMDKETDTLHELIHRNWRENRVSKIVLSCATLPKPSEIATTLNDFQLRFAREDEETGESVEPEIHPIHSSDCKKTITLLNKEGRCVLPHLLFRDYRDILRCVEHCEQNKTLLRYFNVDEIVRCILYLETRGELAVPPEKQFPTMHSLTLHSLKMYYLSSLKTILPEKWPEIHHYLTETLKSHFDRPPRETGEFRKFHSVDSATASSVATPSTAGVFRRVASVASPPTPPSSAAGILLTTRDAHTLTDGPTIFLAEDVEKIGKFYIQQTKIPENIFQAILEKIERNNGIQRRMDILEKECEDKLGDASADGGKGGDKDRSKKAEREPADKETRKLMEQIAILRDQISMVSLNAVYIPNTKQHQEVWLPPGEPIRRNAFVPNIDEEDVREIMGLSVENQKKLLLILGIGVFQLNSPPQYAETMKRLANEQRLFLIIASSDYIYGTNYQFCHGFIGKDLANMTQQKTIQAIGRIGRNNIQHEYTVRFRDDAILEQLFSEVVHNQEAVIMSRLFSSGEEDE